MITHLLASQSGIAKIDPIDYPEADWMQDVYEFAAQAPELYNDDLLFFAADPEQLAIIKAEAPEITRFI